MNYQNKVLIFLVSAIIAGYGYGMNMPQAVEMPLREAPYNYTNFQFNLMYFFTFLPVIFLQVPIGILIDKIPFRTSLFFFALLGFTASLTIGFAFSFMSPGYKWIVDIFRSVFGLSGQALFTVQAVLLTYFAKQNFQVSIGICLTLPFTLDAFNSIITTHIYRSSNNIPLVWYISACFSYIPVLASFMIDKKYLQEMEEMRIEGSVSESNKAEYQAISDQIWQLQSQNKNKESINCGIDINLKLSKQEVLKLQKIRHELEENQNEQFDCASIKDLSRQFWVVCAAIFFFQASLGPYCDNLNDLIVKRFNIEYTDAGIMLLIPNGLLVFTSYGLSKLCFSRPTLRRPLLLLISIIYFITLTLIYFLPNTNQPTFVHYFMICVFLIVMNMMFASNYCSLFGSISYFVKKSQIGTAYSIGCTALCACQCLGPLWNSFILDQYTVLRDSYTLLSLVGAFIGILPILFALWIQRNQFQILDFNLKDDFTIKQGQK